MCFTFNKESLKRNVVALVAVVAPWPAHASVLSGWVAQRERDVQLSVAAEYTIDEKINAIAFDQNNELIAVGDEIYHVHLDANTPSGALGYTELTQTGDDLKLK